MAQGHSNLFFRLEVIKKIIGTTLLISGSFYGVIGIAWSQVLSGVMAFTINAYYTKKFLDYGFFAQTRDFLAILFISVFMALVIYGADMRLHLIPALQLTTLSLLGIFIFSGIAYVLHITALKDVLSLLQRTKDTTLNH
jgi:O-antigen/teichoic acid export membrane protein